MPRNRELMRAYDSSIFHFSEHFMEVRFPIEGAESTPQVTPQVEELLNLLQVHGELGTLDIVERLGLNNRKHVRTTYINPALELGLIEYTIPDKPSSRLQKYRLKRQ